MNRVLRIASICSIAASFVACAGENDEGRDTGDSIAEVSQAAATVNHWIWNGGSANLAVYDQYGSLYLDVWEGGTASNRTATVWLNSSAVDPTSEVCETYTWCWDPGYGTGGTGGMGGDAGGGEQCQTESYCYYTRYTFSYGWGSVSPERVRMNAGNAAANLDLASEPDFHMESCTVDYANWSYTCSSEIGDGIVDVRWTKDGAYSSFQNGVTEQSYGKYTYRTSGTSRSSSANVSGSLFGTPIGGLSKGWIATGKNVSKDMFVTPKP